MTCYRSGYVSALFTILILTGCGGSSGPSVEYVEGIVKLDGQPVEGVTVSFSPASPDGMGAVGTTDANGVYKMTAFPTGDVDRGAVAGMYSVGLEKVRSTSTVTSISTDDPEYSKKMAEMSGRSQSSLPTVEYVIPKKYGNPTTSGLKVTVKSGTNKGEEFNFDLKKE